MYPGIRASVVPATVRLRAVSGSGTPPLTRILAPLRSWNFGNIPWRWSRSAQENGLVQRLRCESLFTSPHLERKAQVGVIDANLLGRLARVEEPAGMCHEFSVRIGVRKTPQLRTAATMIKTRDGLDARHHPLHTLVPPLAARINSRNPSRGGVNISIATAPSSPASAA